MAATSQLTTGSNIGGAQGSTGDPQQSSSSSDVAPTTGTDQVQSGTSSSVLTSNGGIPLTSTSAPAINLGATTVQAATATVQPPHHTPNPVLVGMSGLLFVVAVVLFWTTSRSAKNTTE